MDANQKFFLPKYQTSKLNLHFRLKRNGNEISRVKVTIFGNMGTIKTLYTLLVRDQD